MIKSYSSGLTVDGGRFVANGTPASHVMSGGSGDSWAGSAYGSYAYHHTYGGDPVDVATGNLSLGTTDVSVPEPGPAMAFTRSYNGQSDIASRPRRRRR